MGQYYKAVLITEKNVKIIEPNGYKMMEHCYYGNNTMARVEKLLLNNPQNVIWLWDYAPCASFIWEYRQWDDVENLYAEEKDVLKHSKNKNYYLLNYTRREYINMTKQEMNEKLEDNRFNIVHPLWLLCRADSQEAWWDYRSAIWRENIWLRCWDKIWVICTDKEIEKSWIKITDDERTDCTDVLYFKE